MADGDEVFDDTERFLDVMQELRKLLPSEDEFANILGVTVGYM